MPELIPVLSKADIDAGIDKIAAQISEDFHGQKLIVIGVLKGAFVFMADLVRQLSPEVQIDFISASSYGNSSESSGQVTISQDIKTDITDQHVLIVEDIVDSGVTLDFLVNRFEKTGAASVSVCTLIDKKERRQTDVLVKYSCYEIAEGFLVGYGLDYAENYRHLPAIYHLKFNK